LDPDGGAGEEGGAAAAAAAAAASERESEAVIAARGHKLANHESKRPDLGIGSAGVAPGGGGREGGGGGVKTWETVFVRVQLSKAATMAARLRLPPGAAVLSSLTNLER